MVSSFAIVAVLLLPLLGRNSFAAQHSGRYGCLASPNFPSQYPNGVLTSDTITVAPGSTIRLRFLDFEIENHHSCGFDYLEVVEKNGASRKFCGTSIQEYYSQENELTIRFKTDGSVVAKGYFLTYVEKNGAMPSPSPSLSPSPYPSPAPVDGGWCSYNWSACSQTCGWGYQSGYRQCACPPPSNGGMHCQGPAYTSRGCNYGSCPTASPSSSPSPSPSPSPSACHRVMTSLSGSFSSPGHPSSYPNNAHCIYRIVVPTNKHIILQFNSFDLEQGYDTLIITMKQSGTSVHVASLTGSLNSTRYTSAENEFALEFRSDGSVTRPGFSASYYTIDAAHVVNGGWCSWVPATPCSATCGHGYQMLSRSCQCPAPSNGGANCTGPSSTHTSCLLQSCPTSYTSVQPSPTPFPSPSPVPRCQLQSFTSPTGQFQSPNYPSNYPDGANCQYFITVESGKVIQITFNPFSLEQESSCRYDSVKIYEGTSANSSPAATLCGDGAKSFTSRGNSIFIQFSSDGSVNSQGFSATYTAIIKPTGSGGATVNDPSCGISKVPQGRVIGGTDAAKGAWPWQVGMYQQGSFICGGTLIAPNWILTASHCVVSYGTVGNAADYEIVAGDLHRQLNDTTEQKHQVERIFAHPNYDGSSINNDIALMKLQTPVLMNDYVKTACIPEKNETIAIGSPCFITGWGKIKHPGSAHVMLQQAKLPVVNSSVCQAKIDKLGWGLTITKQMVCAGEEGSIKSGCHGDSGGPFVCPDARGRFYLHGDVSWGSGRCDTSEAFTVFARVTEFVDWVKTTLRDN